MNHAISGEILAKESRFPQCEIFFATLLVMLSLLGYYLSWSLVFWFSHLCFIVFILILFDTILCDLVPLLILPELVQGVPCLHSDGQEEDGDSVELDHL